MGSKDSGSDEELQKKFELHVEELAAVKEDLSLRGLNFGLLRRKLLRLRALLQPPR